MIAYGVVAHGGAGAPEEFSDGCRAACEVAFEMLEAGRPALDAAVGAARILEDDGRFNAGRGSAVRLDGKTVEMDAAVMDSRGRIGAVISIRGVRNPVLVAQAVTETPHTALSGQGATSFARRKGFGPFHEISPRALERHKKIMQSVREGRVAEENPLWDGYSLEDLWNFEGTHHGDVFSCDTIGAAALDKAGNFAVAVSTGGAAPMLLGRVGDCPMIGCGFYAGAAGAIAATGIGEEIIRRMVAREVYGRISGGEETGEALEKEIRAFPHEISVGVIALSATGYAVRSNRKMPHYAIMKRKP